MDLFQIGYAPFTPGRKQYLPSPEWMDTTQALSRDLMRNNLRRHVQGEPIGGETDGEFVHELRWVLKSAQNTHAQSTHKCT